MDDIAVWPGDPVVCHFGSNSCSAMEDGLGALHVCNWGTVEILVLSSAPTDDDECTNLGPSCVHVDPPDVYFDVAAVGGCTTVEHAMGCFVRSLKHIETLTVNLTDPGDVAWLPFVGWALGGGNTVPWCLVVPCHGGPDFLSGCAGWTPTGGEENDPPECSTCGGEIRRHAFGVATRYTTLFEKSIELHPCCSRHNAGAS